MPPIRTHNSRTRHFTPPPDLSLSEGQIKTPQRCGVLYARAFSQVLNILISQELVREVTGVAPRIQRRILEEKETRTLHNRPDIGPDPRGRKRALTRADTRAIGDYLDDPAVPLDNKGKPWLDIAEDAGVTLPETTHFKPSGLRSITSQTVQRACKVDEDIITAICEEEKQLTTAQATGRLDWINEQLPKRPHSKD